MKWRSGRTSLSEKKTWSALMRAVMVGDVFPVKYYIDVDCVMQRRCLYVRLSSDHVGCVVTSSGVVDFTPPRAMRVSAPAFNTGTELIVFTPEESARRIMLVAHGLVRRALELPQERADD